jgi:hypothetical protein
VSERFVNVFAGECRGNSVGIYYVTPSVSYIHITSFGWFK